MGNSSSPKPSATFPEGRRVFLPSVCGWKTPNAPAHLCHVHKHRRPALPPGGENQPSSPSGQDEGERGFLAPLPLEQIPGLSHIQAAAKGGEHVSTHTHPSPDTHHPQGQHGTTRGGQNLNKVGPKSRDLRKLHSKVKRGNYVPKDNTCYKLSRNQNRKPTPLPPVPFCFYLTE